MRLFGLALIALWACATTTEVDAQAAVVTPFYLVVQAGGTIRLDAFTALNPDCTTVGGSSARLVQPPQGGEVLVGRERLYTNYVTLNPRAACNTRRTLQTAVNYRASPTFSGRDSFVIEEEFPNGVARMVRFTVNVRPGGTAVAGSAPQARASCSTLDGLASRDASVPTSIVFANRSREPRDILWVDYQGSEVKYRTLGPGERYGQQTFLSHPWVVADEAGRCLKVVLPTAAGNTVAIR